MNAWKALALPALIGLVGLFAGACSKAKCAPANCSGCCDTVHNTCVTVAQQTASLCGGSVGVACSACGTGQSCVNGVCSGGNGNCNATTCPTGCCASGLCITNIALNAAQCGQAGQSCAPCGNGSACNLVANGGVCGGPDGGGVGAPCKQNSDCAAVGPGAVCFQQTSIGVPYVNGYCTLDCTNTNVCPGTATCVGGNPGYGEITYGAMCWAACGPNQTCREPGYFCYGLNINLPDGGVEPGGQGCWIWPAAPDGITGHACGQDLDCHTAKGPGGALCELGVTDAGFTDGGVGPSGWEGGYCLPDCTPWAETSPRNQLAANSFCGDGGVCLKFLDPNNNAFDLCFEKCGNPGAQDICNPGYVCHDIPVQFGALGRCMPDCRNPGYTCGTGTLCDAGSGFCQ